MLHQSIDTANATPVSSNIENQAELYNGSITIQLGTFGRKRHAYFWVENGLFVPGTTSITKILDKPALMPWAAKMTAEHVKKELNAVVEKNDKGRLVATIPKTKINAFCDAAKKAYRTYTDEQADIGHQIHDYANRMFKGEYIGDLPKDINPHVRNGVEAIQAWVRQNDVTPLGAEQIVFSRKWFFAGTYDLLATVNGRLALIDFKSSKGIYREHLLQTAGYTVAWEEEHGEPINDRFLIRTDKFTGEFEAHHYPRNQLEMDTFLRLKEVDENLKRMEQAA